MKNNILGAVSVSLAVLLAACGQSTEVTGGPNPGGNGGGSQAIAPVARSAVALRSKEDALRELRVSSLVAGQVAGGNINLGAKKREQPLAWAFGHGERAGAGNSLGQHSFVLLQGAQPSVDRFQTSHANAVSKFATASGATETLTINGVTERGQSPDQSVSYEQHGTGQASYSESRERRSSGGTLLASETLQLQGLSEVSWPTGGTLDARGLLKYRFRNNDGHFFNADIGESGAPFTVQQNQALSYAGSYAYELPGQSSGLATAATLVPIAFDSTGDHPASGVLRVVSGGDTAIFTFRPDGGATLELNQSQQEVSAGEIRSALLGS